jgi:TonB family protein
MKYRILLVSLFLAGFGCLQIQGQVDQGKAASKIVSIGVINGKALSLPKPEFPATAMAVGASGAVNVQVIIDEEGNVASATAISGHPLLREASVSAARQAKFQPTMLSGVPVKITGIIVYNFAGVEKLPSWRSAGYEMTIAEQDLRLSLKFPAGPIAAFLPAGWNDEKLEMLKLKAVQNSVNSSGSAQGQMVTADQTIDIASVNHKQVLSSLKTSFENRLNSEQNDLWNFKLGLLLGKMSLEIDNDEALRANIQELQHLEVTAPAGLGKALDSFGEFAGRDKFSAEDKAVIRLMIEKLKAL